jgi:BirA family biotin operon repressor/biotin-[acetyl-CoA-carboxylase] ligase
MNDLNADPQATDLNEKAITEALTTRWLGQPVHYFAELDSTNSTLAEMAESGAPHGTLVITDYQRQGKGRHQRRWEAPARSSLLLSLLFHPNWPAEQANWLVMIGGLAALRTIELTTALAAGLKWPNDVMVRTNKGWRKAGGLLLETSLSGATVEQAILGIGLNVNIPTADLPSADPPATSLLGASGRPVSRLRLLARLLQTLESLYEAAAEGQSPETLWTERLLTLGQQVTVSDGEHTVSGMATATDNWGRLLVRDDAGRTYTFAAGDVTLRKKRR